MAHDDTPLNERLEELLRRRPWQGAAGGEGCGDPELLAAYAEGQLPAAARERMEQHLAACAACQTAVARLVRMAPQESAAAAAGAGARAAQPARWSLFRWRWAVPALAGVVLAGVFIYTGREQLTERAKPEAPAPSARHQAAEPVNPEVKPGVKTAPQAESSSASTPAVAPPPGAARSTPRETEMQVGRDVRGAPALSAGEKDREEQRQRVAAAKPQQQETLAVGKLQQQRPTHGGKPLQQQPMAAGGERQQPMIIGGPQQQQRMATGRAQQQPSVAAEAAPQLSVAQQAAPRAAPAAPRAAPAAPPPAASQARAADADRPREQQSQLAGAVKKEAPQDLLDEARSQKTAETRAKSGYRATEPPAVPRAVVPETEAKRGAAREDRYAQRAEANEEKADARANVAEGRRAPAPAAGAAAGAGTVGGIAAGTGGGTGRMSMEARNAAAPGSFRKQVPAGRRQLALTASGQLLVMPAESRVWRPLSIPSGAAVVDFAVFGEHLWVLLPGGRVGHSSDLGRTWDPPIETKVEDATSVSFTSPRSGEIQTRSGRRLRTTDGGESWHPVR